MGKILQDILKSPQCKCLKVIAGGSGLSAEVKWTVSSETIEYIHFIGEGDVVFNTGVAIRDGDALLQWAKAAFERKAAAIVFAPGPHISEIPQSIIDFGNEKNLTILTMPWEEKIATISYAMIDYISKKENESADYISTLKHLLLTHEPIDLPVEFKDKIKEVTFSKGRNYRILLFRIVEGPEDKQASSGLGKKVDKTIEKILGEIQEAIAYIFFSKAIPVAFADRIAFVLVDGATFKIEQADEINKLIALVDFIQKKEKTIGVKIGIGDVYDEIENLFQSYKEAFLVTNIFSFEMQYKKGLYQYDKLGVYKLILDSGNTENMIFFSKNMLEPLKHHDEANQTFFIEFIKTYFECNGNTKELSEKLFLHKNTVLYKIKKIESILSCNISLLEDSLNLKLALMIDDIFSQNPHF